MGGDRDEVMLSEWERERLAGIEENLAAGDPGLRRRLAGLQGSSMVGAIALVILGGATAVATFTRWLWLAVVGLAVMAAGIGLAVRPVVARLRRYRPTNPPSFPGG